MEEVEEEQECITLVPQQSVLFWFIKPICL
jgi:hypothetical protein